VEFPNTVPIRDVFARDFGITGWRARSGLIGITTPVREAIGAALERAVA
jgi:hypothetical protein